MAESGQSRAVPGRDSPDAAPCATNDEGAAAPAPGRVSPAYPGAVALGVERHAGTPRAEGPRLRGSRIVTPM